MLPLKYTSNCFIVPLVVSRHLGHIILSHMMLLLTATSIMNHRHHGKHALCRYVDRALATTLTGGIMFISFTYSDNRMRMYSAIPIGSASLALFLMAKWTGNNVYHNALHLIGALGFTTFAITSEVLEQSFFYA